jgi:hypothetical protein
LQHEILTEAVERLYSTGVIAVSITFDGTSTNCRTLALPGGTFDADNPISV